MTINAEGSQGADVKHKVFWVTGCVPAPTTTTSGATSTSGATTTSGATSTSGITTTTSGATSTSQETTTTSAVGGASSSAPSSAAGGELPFTGAATTMPLLAIGLALLGLGGASLLGKSRRGRT